MKILGFGIDLERLERFDAKISKIDDYLIRRFLTNKEYGEYEKITNRHGRVRFLCSHWTAKEAVYKAMNASNKPLHKIELTRLENGHLVYCPENITEIEGKLSLTYSEGYCSAACVLVQKELAPTTSNDLSAKSEVTNACKKTNTQILELLTTISLETQKELAAVVEEIKEIREVASESFERYKNSGSEKLFTRTAKIDLEHHQSKPVANEFKTVDLGRISATPLQANLKIMHKLRSNKNKNKK